MVIKVCNQLIQSVETEAYRKSKDLECTKEKLKWNNIIEQYKKWLTKLAANS